jgi:hypothetical protein
MKMRMIWEEQEVANVRHYSVVGERCLLDDGEHGWYVSSWSNSVPIIGYWFADGKFYQALINWVTGTIIDLEIIREIELDPERKRITVEAIDQWKNHPDGRVFGHATMDESAFHLAAA